MAAGGDREGARPIGELLKELSHETATLVHQEVELAKAELNEKGKKAGAGAAAFAVAAAMALGALGALTAGLILALAAVVPAWLAALIVSLVYVAIAGALAEAGKKKVQRATPPIPEQTVESVKEDMEWAKSRVRSARR